MKKVIVLALCAFLNAQTVTAESVFQADYDEHKALETLGMVLVVSGCVIAGISLIVAWVGSTEPVTYEDLNAPFLDIEIIIGGIGGGMAGGGGGLWYNHKNHVYRLGIAIEYEAEFSTREIDAILNETLFIGMSELALRASKGMPSNINTSTGTWGTHKQYVYGDYGPYVYVEDGKVTSWQD